jgi:flagellar basal-body rod protein FlgG
MRSLNISGLGASTAAKAVDVIANNIANANTNAFKKSFLLTQDLQYQNTPVKSLAEVVPSNIQFGSGVAVASTIRDQHEGDILQTGRQLDFRIAGKGFFVVNYSDGVQRFTRDGSFHVSSAGEIVTKEGYTVTPGINVPDNYSRLSVREDGMVLADFGNNEPPQELGQLQIVKFINEDGMESQSGNYLNFTQASGEPIVGTAGQEDFGRILQGELEGSNVKPVIEMTDMIKNQRAYELNIQVLQKSDQMYKKATDV